MPELLGGRETLMDELALLDRLLRWPSRLTSTAARCGPNTVVTQLRSSAVSAGAATAAAAASGCSEIALRLWERLRGGWVVLPGAGGAFVALPPRNSHLARRDSQEEFNDLLSLECPMMLLRWRCRGSRC